MKTLNVGILAHVDAGKTSLTERLLHATGVLDEIGSVDEGSTRTDSMALERQRGITIRSAVVSFVVGDVTVNLIDTPGHPDFIAEVERVLGVLDGAVLVISAVEGVQAQTRVLMRTLQRLRVPTLIFVNKVDRAGADPGRVLRGIAERLTPAVVAMTAVDAVGTRAARCTPYDGTDVDFTDRLVDLLAEHDDELLASYVTDQASVTYGRLRRALATQTGRARTHPVFFGSAITGAGVYPLIAGLTELLPAATGDSTGPVSGTVFKIERGPAGEKIAYARIFAGAVRVRDRLRYRDGEEGKVTAVSVFADGDDAPCPSVGAGRIAKLWGLGDIRVGDPIGEPPDRPAGRHQFSPPTLETVVVPRHAAERAALHAALAQLAEQDPLINLRQDDVRQELSVSLYGEVQKEVIEATLADDFGVGVTFRESTTVCVERPVGAGAAVEFIGQAPNPFLGTVGLRVEPAPVDAGFRFRLGIELGSMPPAFLKAIEETVRETLRQGLCGWQVLDCTVTLTHGGYWARQSHSHAVFDKSMSSTAGDFRNLTSLVLVSALRQARTRVYEPIHRFRLEVPADLFGAVLPVLARLDAVPATSTEYGSAYLIEGDVPAARVHGLERQLPSLTRGEGVLESAFDHYRPVRGVVPTRPRWDHNPLDRKDYLLRVARRVTRQEDR
ncbi:TetM/TetW/TetO/TetS family tetracycline resistance ribosomal protection protein [Micromonospora sp. ATA32]|nr:TetM/TetW/TetO/TetS family tetracycline resistance ribosomal protection protein [Micromonospora sp. ATA32]